MNPLKNNIKILGIDYGKNDSSTYLMMRTAEEYGKIYSATDLIIYEDRRFGHVIIFTDQFKIEILVDNCIKIYDNKIQAPVIGVIARVSVNFEEALNFLLDMNGEEIISASAQDINEKIQNILLIG